MQLLVVVTHSLYLGIFCQCLIIVWNWLIVQFCDTRTILCLFYLLQYHHLFWFVFKPNSTRLFIPMCFIALFLLHLWPLRAPYSYHVSFPSAQPIIFRSYSCPLCLTIFSQIMLVGHLCAPVLFRSYLWPLWVSHILPVVLVTLPCAPYYSVHDCDPL